jgi:hypothetical protein
VLSGYAGGVALSKVRTLRALLVQKYNTDTGGA